MLIAGYGFCLWALNTALTDPASLPPGYKYIVILTAVPFFLAAHGFALLRWSQLRQPDDTESTIRDMTTDVSLSAWEIFFCWLGICASLMFLYYAAPITDLNDWYPRLFLVLVVFFGATYQKTLVFVFALMPFVMTLSALAIWDAGVSGPALLRGDYDTPVAVGLLAVDAAILWWAIGLARRHGAFRVRELRLPLGPGQVGRYLAAVIRSRQKEMPASGFHVELSCLRQFKDGKRAQGEVLWYAEKVARGDLPGARHPDTSVPVAFQIPASAPPTSAKEDERVAWTLRAKAALPETDFSCSFVVPVEKDGQATSGASLAHVTYAPGAQPPAPPAVAVRHGDGSTLFRFAPLWNRATELITAAYFLFWFQLVWLATSDRASWETWAMFGAGLWFLGLVIAPWLSSTEVQFHRGLVKVTNRTLGFKRKRVIVLRQVRDIKTRTGRLRTGLTDALEYYYLQLEEDSGRVLTVGRHLRDRGSAESVAEEMRQVLAATSN